MRAAFCIFFALVLVSAILSQTTAKPVLEFEATGSAPAHGEFIKGVIALHNSAYDDAADDFRAAEKLDPSMVMAYWGEALTFNHPFQAHEQKLEDARTVLAKLGPSRTARAAKAKTPRERDYLIAVEDLFGDGDLKTRDERFAEDMHQIMLRYPSDTEAGVFYALSLLGVFEPGRDRSYSKQTIAIPILKSALSKYPNHPGALHYLIHCYDDPEHAQLGLEAARHYEQIASDLSSHALHMPSHIYVQLGLWEDAKRANQKAFAATQKHAQLKNVSPMNLDYHTLNWLMYSDLQLGQYKEARDCAELMLKTAQQFDTAEGRRMIAAAAEEMFGPFAMETGEWDVLAQFPARNAEPNLLVAQGFAAAARKEPGAIREILAVLDRIAEDRYARDEQYEGARVDALGKELAGRLAMIENRPAEAERLASEALQFEDKVEFPSGPPDLPKPAHEFYGEILLADKKPAQAAAQFTIALKRTPKRALSLLGLARAQTRMDESASAGRTYRELAQIWAHADPSIPAVIEVRSKLTSIQKP